MPDLATAVLPADPNDWLAEHMWDWVNQVVPLVETGACKVGMTIEMMPPHGRSRPIFIRFDRPSLVATQGYSWDRHIADEMVQIEFLAEQVRLLVVENLPAVLLARVVTVAAMARMADQFMPAGTRGIAPLSLGDGDWGQQCIAFASQSASAWLVPDPYFFLTRAYAAEKREIAENTVAWESRRPQLYWRGAPSGLLKYANHAESQRVRFVIKAATSPISDSFNIRFAGLDGMDEAVAQAVRAVGGDGPREPQMHILNYRYNADVDGWSCAWTGFFTKLLTGAPVLKITSDRGFRQWYYHALKPWRHVVPVAADLSDLETAVAILDARPDWAQEIGCEGKLLAETLTYESQLAAAGQTIARFVGAYS